MAEIYYKENGFPNVWTIPDKTVEDVLSTSTIVDLENQIFAEHSTLDYRPLVQIDFIKNDKEDVSIFAYLYSDMLNDNHKNKYSYEEIDTLIARARALLKKHSDAYLEIGFSYEIESFRKQTYTNNSSSYNTYVVLNYGSKDNKFSLGNIYNNDSVVRALKSVKLFADTLCKKCIDLKNEMEREPNYIPAQKFSIVTISTPNTSCEFCINGTPTSEDAEAFLEEFCENEQVEFDECTVEYNTYIIGHGEVDTNPLYSSEQLYDMYKSGCLNNAKFALDLVEGGNITPVLNTALKQGLKR